MTNLLQKLLAVITLFTAQFAFAFGEDLCMNLPKEGQDPLFNCISLPADCKPGNNTARCRAAAFNSVPQDAESISGGRSMLHVDSTYYLAQAIGFDSWTAYQIAMYDGDTDTGQYVPHNQKGEKIIKDPQTCFNDPKSDPICAIMPPLIKGVNRFNGDTGGLLIHFGARFNVENTAEPVPFPYDYFSDRRHEKQINDIHDWAFNIRDEYCVFGLTGDMDVKKQGNHTRGCLAGQNGTEAFVKGHIPLSQFGPDRGGISVQALMGEQIVALSDQNQATALSSTMQNIMPHDQIKYAKMGVFLHSIQDRISHHICIDTSTAAEQARLPDNHHFTDNYLVDYNKENCSQGNHMLWHGWEVGGDQSFLNADPSLYKFKTLEAGLNETYDQLIAFARLQHVRINPHLDKAQIIHELMQPLQIYNPRERLDGLVQLFEKKGFTPLPGHGHMANYSDITNWLSQNHVVDINKTKKVGFLDRIINYLFG
jgi:hypothetical protein